MTVLDHVPAIVPPMSLTSDGINWPAEHSAGAPFDQAHVHVTTGTIPLAEIRMGDAALSEVTLTNQATWDDVSTVVLAHFPNGWETVLFIEAGDEGLTAVSLPTAALADGNTPPEFHAYLVQEISTRLDAGLIETVGDNLTGLLTPPVTTPVVSRDPSAIETAGWQDRTGSIVVG